MSGHVTAWLAAYHDGELGVRRSRQVESHLADCEACCAELEELRGLSALLLESPVAGDLMTPERFVAQVGLRLLRRPTRPAWQRVLEVGWRLTPLGLLGTWVVVQAVLIVSGVTLIALQMGLGGEAGAWLLPAPQPESGLADVFRLSAAGLGDMGQIVGRLLSLGGPLGWSAALNLISLVVIGLLYWSWLASWWVRRQRQQQPPRRLERNHV
jgi:predicted anti-sigma-YlaC factor YlaD